MPTILTEPFKLPALSLCSPSGPVLEQIRGPSIPQLPSFVEEYSNPLGLPAIGMPIDSKPSPVQNIVNPGDFSPQAQQFSPPSVDQTRTVTHHGQGAAYTSDGQFQRRDLKPGSQGVSVSPGNGLAMESSGQFQRRDFHKPEEAVAGPGLAVNVSADQQNFAKPIKTFAVYAPVAVDVDAGSQQRLSKLPKGVVIR